MITNEVKGMLDQSGVKVAGWLITGTIILIGAMFLYTKYLESRKLHIDYKISQYELQKRMSENPDFLPNNI